MLTAAAAAIHYDDCLRELAERYPDMADTFRRAYSRQCRSVDMLLVKSPATLLDKGISFDQLTALYHLLAQHGLHRGAPETRCFRRLTKG